MKLKDRKWRSFSFGKVFNIKTGFFEQMLRNDGGLIPCVQGVDRNNGVSSYYTAQAIEEATATKPYGGESIPFSTKVESINSICIVKSETLRRAYYQPQPFVTSNEIVILQPIGHSLTREIGLFLTTCIESQNKIFKRNFLKHPLFFKWTRLKLPVDTYGNIDWDFMQAFIQEMAENKQKLISPNDHTGQYIPTMIDKAGKNNMVVVSWQEEDTNVEVKDPKQKKNAKTKIADEEKAVQAKNDKQAVQSNQSSNKNAKSKSKASPKSKSNVNDDEKEDTQPV